MLPLFLTPAGCVDETAVVSEDPGIAAATAARLGGILASLSYRRRGHPEGKTGQR